MGPGVEFRTTGLRDNNIINANVEQRSNYYSSRIIPVKSYYHNILLYYSLVPTSFVKVRDVRCG